MTPEQNDLCKQTFKHNLLVFKTALTNLSWLTGMNQHNTKKSYQTQHSESHVSWIARLEILYGRFSCTSGHKRVE